jgi:glycerol-3-phosphate acyltransferase PlsX
MMNGGNEASGRVRIAIDAMGSDRGIETVLDGIAQAAGRGLDADLLVFGREGELRTAMASRDLPNLTLHHAEDAISMDDKPTAALRRRKSSMWAAIEAVKSGTADAVVSSGNTGALMAMSVLQLRVIEGVDRPAISALWPTVDSECVVLDVGANVEASAKQLVQFAIMGEAYYRALRGKERPAVGLLNVGEEELKGHTLIRQAATILREADPEMAFRGFIEGDDISGGEVDVVVTDGFTGNVALKTAEGTARMVGGWLKTALTSSARAKVGAAVLMPALRSLKDQMNPSRVNGAPLLGLNGLVIKSHGGADAYGVASAIRTAELLARSPFRDEIARKISNVEARAAEKSLDEEPATAAAE